MQMELRQNQTNKMALPVKLSKQMAIFGILISLILKKNMKARADRYSYHKLKSPFLWPSVIRGAHEEHVNLSPRDTLKPSVVHAHTTPAPQRPHKSAVSGGLHGYTSRASCKLGGHRGADILKHTHTKTHTHTHKHTHT